MTARRAAPHRMSGEIPNGLQDRFWAKVDRRSDAECWNWTGSTVTGYGQLHWSPEVGRPLRAHRISWRLHFGPIPEKKLVTHTCDNTMCVNPRHLRLGTHSDNMADQFKRGRRPEYEMPKMCRKGLHAMTDDNLRIERPRRARPYYVCRACYVERNRRADARKWARRGITREEAMARCRKGHLYAEVGFKIHPKHGYRQCKACLRACAHRYLAKQRVKG